MFINTELSAFNCVCVKYWHINKCVWYELYKRQIYKLCVLYTSYFYTNIL